MDIKDYKPKISNENKAYFDKIKELAENNTVVGVLDVTSLPAPQFQEIRSKLYGRADILIVKKNLIEIAFKELESKFKGIIGLNEKIIGVCGLIFTNENPFKIFKFIQKNKSEAPAKSGQVAPKDIWVKACTTSFAPGPIIGELGALKMKAGIDDGKVAIKEDALVAKEGEVISQKLAEILTRLDIKPMEVGLNIKGMFEDGIIYERNVLDVDESYYTDMLTSAVSESFALGIGLGYHTTENISYFIAKTFRDAAGLALGIDYVCKDNVDKILLKSYSQALGVAKQLPSDIVPVEASNVASTGNVSSSSDSAQVEEVKEDKKEETDSNPAAGLGSLFG